MQHPSLFCMGSQQLVAFCLRMSSQSTWRSMQKGALSLAPCMGTLQGAVQIVVRSAFVGYQMANGPPSSWQGGVCSQCAGGPSAPASQLIIYGPMCRGDPPPLPASSWFTVQGYRDRWQRFIGGAKSMYTLAKCRKYVPGFSLPGFKADVLRIYEDACSGIARGDRTLLRQVQCHVYA